MNKQLDFTENMMEKEQEERGSLSFLHTKMRSLKYQSIVFKHLSMSLSESPEYAKVAETLQKRCEDLNSWLASLMYYQSRNLKEFANLELEDFEDKSEVNWYNVQYIDPGRIQPVLNKALILLNSLEIGLNKIKPIDFRAQRFKYECLQYTVDIKHQIKDLID